jgi:adenosylhomocysteinase
VSDQTIMNGPTTLTQLTADFGAPTMNERLENLAKRFFDRVLQLCEPGAERDFVVVTHLLEDRPWFLRAVEKLGPVCAVIPKRKSIVPRVRDVLRHEFPILEIGRADLTTREGVTAHLMPLYRQRPLCLLDIGGYFEPLARVGLPSGLAVAGVVEDTENGHVKYEAAISTGQCKLPVFSVARSDLKRPENFLVGQSLVFSVEAILRQRDELLHGRSACVVGYGNIGRSVAQHLHERHVRVVVFDTDPMKRVEAFTHGFPTPTSLIEALKGADVVFCATGNKCLGAEEIRSLRPCTYVATVTSPDDELRTGELNWDLSHRGDNVTELRRRDGTVIYLMNRGQAVNFVHGSVVGPFIQLLQAEILVAAALLGKPRDGVGIGTVPTTLRKQIAQAWLEVYGH